MSVQVDAVKLPAEVAAVIAVAKENTLVRQMERKIAAMERRRAIDQAIGNVMQLVAEPLWPFCKWGSDNERMPYGNVYIQINVPGCKMFLFETYMYSTGPSDLRYYSLPNAHTTHNTRFEDWRLALAAAVEVQMNEETNNNGKD